ncbi:MAG: ABC transporter permease, partial [Pseudolabrys sp.]
FPLVVAAVAAAFLWLFFPVPIWQVFSASIFDLVGKTLTLSNYTQVLSNRFFLSGLTNSLTIAAAAAAVNVLIGVHFAFCLARLPIAGKSVLLALAALPLVLPSFVSAYALVLMFGRAGIVTGVLRNLGIPFESIYGMKGIITAYALTLYPYVVLPSVAAFKSLDVSVEEAAQNLGASRLQMLRTVTLPIVLPSILAGGLLVFIEALENFGVPFVLAEDKPILAVEAFKLFVSETAANPASAGVLGTLLIACTIVALLIQRGVLARRYSATGARRSPPLLIVSKAVRALGAAYCWLVVGAALVPFFAVIAISFMRFSGPVLHYEPSLNNFVQLLGQSYRPLTNTLLLSTLAALGATLIGVPIGYLLVRRRSRLSSLLDIIATAPFAVAGTVLGIGLVLSYSSGFLILTGTWIIMVVAYVVRKLPFSVKSSSAILHQIDQSLEEASVNLGVAPFATFMRITVPLILGGIVGGTVLTFVTVASELSSTVVLYSGPWITMTVTMFQALEGNSPGVATAAATILILFTTIPVALVYRLLRRHELSML